MKLPYAATEVSEWRQFTATKDVLEHPFFLGATTRWAWRFYMYRFTHAGLWFLAISFMFAAYVGSTSLEMQAYVPFAYACGIWGVAILAALAYRPRIALRTIHSDRICAGEILRVELTAEQQSARSTRDLFILPHRLPLAVDAVSETGAALPEMRPGETARAYLELNCKRRGVYRLKGYRVETDFPFGILRSYRVIPEERPLIVYPKFTAMAQLEIPTGRRYHPGGVALAAVQGDSFEFVGDREFRDGDNIRDIDWRATARLAIPVVREYREEYFLRVAVILDTHIPPGPVKTVEAARESFEQAVSVCAGVSDYMSRQEYLVDILAAGPNLYHLTAGRGLAYLDQILDILACVEECPSEWFGIVEPEILENLEKITTLIFIFLDWTESRREFVERLRQQDAGLKVIIVRDEPCTLDPTADGGVYGYIPVLSSADYRTGVEYL